MFVSSGHKGNRRPFARERWSARGRLSFRRLSGYGPTGESRDFWGNGSAIGGRYTECVYSVCSWCVCLVR